MEKFRSTLSSTAEVLKGDLGEMEKIVELQDLMDHGITKEIMSDMILCATKLQIIVPQLQPLLNGKYLPSNYTRIKVVESLVMRVKHAVREFVGEKFYHIQLEALHVWVMCRELVQLFGHMLPGVFVPRWPNFISRAKSKVEELMEIAAVEDEGTRTKMAKGLETLLWRVWNVFIVDPSSPIIVKVRKVRCDAGQKTVAKRIRDEPNPS